MREWLKAIWEGWKRVAHRIGRFQTLVLLTLSYGLVAGPTWAIMKLSGKDPLKKRASQDSHCWTDCEAQTDLMERAKRQF